MIAKKPNKPVVLSVEQALSMPYATLRFVHLGWRVIRVEPTPIAGRVSKGDPNRYIGKPIAGEDRHSYYVAPNVGKEATAINLKTEEGRALLQKLIVELPVDVFCTNTLPAHHKALGIDYETLSALRPELVWCGISAMGTAEPKVPGYDPAMQALCGYMDLTGEKDGAPLQCGPPITDLKAGDEAFTQAILAMWERDQSGKGKMIDISMAHAAVSWLHTFLPMLDMGSDAADIRRNGNEHRQFIPVNSYPTTDGFIYVAIGSDAQWHRFTQHEVFSSLSRDNYASNEGRRASKADLHAEIAAITQRYSSDEITNVMRETGVPHAPISAIDKVADLEFVKRTALRTTTPDGQTVRLPPPAVPTKHLEALGGELPFPPSYGGDTNSVLEEVGLETTEIDALREQGVIA